MVHPWGDKLLAETSFKLHIHSAPNANTIDWLGSVQQALKSSVFNTNFQLDLRLYRQEFGEWNNSTTEVKYTYFKAKNLHHHNLKCFHVCISLLLGFMTSQSLWRQRVFVPKAKLKQYLIICSARDDYVLTALFILLILKLKLRRQCCKFLTCCLTLWCPAFNHQQCQLYFRSNENNHQSNWTNWKIKIKTIPGWFHVLTVIVKMIVFWDVIVIMMEAVSTSETSVNIYHTTRCNIPEDSHLKKLFLFLKQSSSTALSKLVKYFV
jgi:hypothetical protein